MKKALLALALMVVPALALAEDPPMTVNITDNFVTWKELFKETEGSLIDFVILSAVEGGYAKDFVQGDSLSVIQFPIVNVTPYITIDVAHVSGDDQQGILGAGTSLRVSNLIADAFADRISAVRQTLPLADKVWDKLWFGPFVAKRFEFDSDVLLGIKSGLRF